MDSTLTLLACTLATLACTTSASAQRVTAPDVPMQPALVIRTFDVSDLTGHAALESRRSLLMAEASQLTGEEVAERLQAEARALEEADASATALVDAVTTWIEPAFEDEGPAGPAEQVDWVKGGQLLVIGRPLQQQWVGDFLALQRQDERLISVRCQLWSVPYGVLAGEGLEPGAKASLFEGEAADAMLERLGASGARRVTSPQVTTRPRQRGRMSVTREVSLVTEWELRVVEPGARKIADPVISVVQDGVVLDARITPLDGGLYGMQLKLTVSELEEPIPSYEVELDPDLPKLELSLPTTNIIEMSTTMSLAMGSSTVMAARGPGGDHDLLIVVELIPTEH